MKFVIKLEKEVDFKVLNVKANVRYWNDSEVNGEADTENGDNIPCKIGDLWCPEIDIETGKILNWKEGVSAEIHYKVVDGLAYEIKDDSGNVVLSAEDGYVPNTLSPKEIGYGDYIIMDIDESGQIQDWEFDPCDFQAEE